MTIVLRPGDYVKVKTNEIGGRFFGYVQDIVQVRGRPAFALINPESIEVREYLGELYTIGVSHWNSSIVVINDTIEMPPPVHVRRLGPCGTCGTLIFNLIVVPAPALQPHDGDYWILMCENSHIFIPIRGLRIELHATVPSRSLTDAQTITDVITATLSDATD